MTPDEDVDAIIAKKLKVAISIVFPMFIAKPSKRDFFFSHIEWCLYQHKCSTLQSCNGIEKVCGPSYISTDRHKYRKTNRVKEMLIRRPK